MVQPGKTSSSVTMEVHEVQSHRSCNTMVSVKVESPVFHISRTSFLMNQTKRLSAQSLCSGSDRHFSLKRCNRTQISWNCLIINTRKFVCLERSALVITFVNTVVLI